jgi:hypothetical protein
MLGVGFVFFAEYMDIEPVAIGSNPDGAES